MKHLLAVFAIAGLCLATTAQAHDPLAELEASVSASQDAMQGQINNIGSTIDALFVLIDDLSARLDIIESSNGGLSAAIDDLYALIDALEAAAAE